MFEHLIDVDDGPSNAGEAPEIFNPAQRAARALLPETSRASSPAQRSVTNAQSIRQMILDVAEGLGGAERMMHWVTEHRQHETIFWKDIVTKLLPKEIDARIEGDVTVKNVLALDPATQAMLAELRSPALPVSKSAGVVDVTAREVQPSRADNSR